MVYRRFVGLLPYVGAVGLVTTATLVRFAMDPMLKGRQPFAVYMIALLLASRFCGFRPSLLALILSALASRYFFVNPRGSFAVSTSVEAGSFWFFCVIGLLFILLMRAEQRSKDDARRKTDAAVQKQRELEHEIEERKRVEAQRSLAEEKLKEAFDALKVEQDLLRNMIDVQENEKAFLCHEFHDGLIQYAVGSLMSLEGFQSKHPTIDDAVAIQTAIDNLRRGVEDGKRTIRGIRPAVLDDSGLQAALDDLIEQYSTTGIVVTGDCDPEIGRLPNSIQTAVYRVAQESLNNARKHSRSETIEMNLKNVDGELHLEIRDFGCGFDVKATRTQGFGLLGMRERVRLLGGEFHLESEHNVGTRILVRLPIPAEVEGSETRAC